MRAGFIAALAMIANATAAKDIPAAPPLQPTSPWRMDYADSECRFLRQFGADGATAIVQFNRDGPLSNLYISVRLIGAPKGFERSGAALRIDDSTKWTDKLDPATIQPDGQLLFTFPRLPREFLVAAMEHFAKDQPVVLRMKVGSSEIALNLQKMRAVKTALEACEDDLMDSMGYDGKALRTLSRQAEPTNPVTHWLTSDDFPVNPLAEGHNGGILFWLEIDETGKPTRCNIIGAIGNDEFKPATCGSLMARASFKPALSASGEPIKSYWKQRVHWLAPNGSFPK